jgi:hypothetical protein
MGNTPTSFLTNGAIDFKKVENQWDDLCAMLPANLEQRGAAHGVLTYKRSFHQVSDLLRLAMAYSINDLSLRTTAAWADEIHLASVSDVAVLKQLRSLRPLLEDLVQHELLQRTIRPVSGFSFTLVDGTSLTTPKGKGTDYRVNLVFDASKGHSIGIRVTPAKIGETMVSSALRPGDVVLGDRHYAQVAPLQAVQAAGARFVVRATRTFPLLSPDGAGCSALSVLKRDLKPGEIVAFPVQMPLDTGPCPARLIAIGTTEEVARQREKKEKQKRAKKGKKGELSAEARRGLRHILIVTTLTAEEASAEMVGKIYQFRWQIELVFKRWKSILQLDRLRANDPDLASTYILTKLLCALLIEAITRKVVAFSPWGTRTCGSLAL